VTAGGVGNVAQRPRPGQHGQPVHRGPDGVLDAGAAPAVQHAGVDQLVERVAQLIQGRAVRPGPAVRSPVGVLLRYRERGCEQPRFLTGELEVRHADCVQPAAGRGGIAVRAAHAADAAALGPPARQVLIVTCLDHRVDPAIVLGLQLADAPVIRNAGGRVTQAVIDDISYLAFLAEQLFGEQLARDTLFEVAVVHHTQCGTGFLADPGYRHQAAGATGLAEAALEASAVADPHATVRADVERLLASPSLSPKVSVSGHVYDIATGHVTTTVDARFPGR
jgi:carbonic anhydrase